MLVAEGKGRYHDPMKILNITAQKPDSTGSGVYLAQLVRAFSRAGHDAGVIAGVAAEDPCEVAGASYTRPVRFETASLPFAVAGMSDEMPYRSTRYRDLTPDQLRCFEKEFSAALDEALAAFKPDAIVCHHLYLLTALVRERVRGIPVVAISHSTDLRQMRAHGLERERIRRAVRALDAVLSLHDAQRDEIIACYGADPARVRVVGTGFDADAFCLSGGSSPASPAPGLADGKPLELVYVGKIARKKGVECLLEALDLMPAAPGGIRLTLVGGYGNETEYAQLRERAAACRQPVFFAGRLPQDALAEAYRAADVFVLPSFYEGLPLVVVEALACGCRVAVSDLPGIRPWLASHASGAPVEFVDPPRMRVVDEPCSEDLPAFQRRLADAIGRAALLPRCTVDLSALSWDSLAARVEVVLREAAGCR